MAGCSLWEAFAARRRRRTGDFLKRHKDIGMELLTSHLHGLAKAGNFENQILVFEVLCPSSSALAAHSDWPLDSSVAIITDQKSAGCSILATRMIAALGQKTS
jgi:hypothetical protein